MAPNPPDDETHFDSDTTATLSQFGLVAWMLEKVWPKSPRDKAHDRLLKAAQELAEALTELERANSALLNPYSGSTVSFVKKALMATAQAMGHNHEANLYDLNH
jgi:hypothetical protein